MSRRRRAGGLAAALGLIALGGAAWHGWPGPLDPTRQVVVFLGDSITSGEGIPPEAAFPILLGRALGVPVRNAGVSGDTSGGGLRRLQSDVLVHRPKLVVVVLGVNDVVDYHQPPAETLGNLRQIARRLRKDGAGVVLVHIRLAEFGSEVYREGFREIARRERAWLVEDFFAGVYPRFTPDGLHPSREGHARLATRLEPLLREILAR